QAGGSRPEGQSAGLRRGPTHPDRTEIRGLMFPHHRASIENVRNHFREDPEVLAVLLGGSIAHGFATELSDIDILIIVGEEAWRKRAAEHRVTFFSRELCTWPGGYVDGKYHSTGFLDLVREQGSEPARFAFEHARILIDR